MDPGNSGPWQNEPYPHTHQPPLHQPGDTMASVGLAEDFPLVTTCQRHLFSLSVDAGCRGMRVYTRQFFSWGKAATGKRRVDRTFKRTFADKSDDKKR